VAVPVGGNAADEKYQVVKNKTKTKIISPLEREEKRMGLLLDFCFLFCRCNEWMRRGGMEVMVMVSRRVLMLITTP